MVFDGWHSYPYAWLFDARVLNAMPPDAWTYDSISIGNMMMTGMMSGFLMQFRPLLGGQIPENFMLRHLLVGH